MIRLIVALDEHGAIGRDGTLPFRQKADMRHFMQATRGATVVMGHATARSLPGLLKGRQHLVLTYGHTVPEGMERVTLGEVLDTYHWEATAETPDLWVIGGGQVYAQFLPLAQQVWVTQVATVIEGADTFFPLAQMLAMGPWFDVSSTAGAADEDNEYPYRITLYSRREEDVPHERIR